MSKLLITTQVYENYAIDEDGEFGTGADAYWKPKGGNDYVVKNFNGFTHPSIAESAEAMIDRLRDRVECDTNVYREYIIGYKVVADDHLTWFEQSQLDYDGKITYPAVELTI